MPSTCPHIAFFRNASPAAPAVGAVSAADRSGDGQAADRHQGVGVETVAALAAGSTRSAGGGSGNDQSDAVGGVDEAGLAVTPNDAHAGAGKTVVAGRRRSAVVVKRSVDAVGERGGARLGDKRDSAHRGDQRGSTEKSTDTTARFI